MSGTTLSYHSQLYYAHSGRAPAGGLIAALTVGCVGALVLGPIYAYVDLYNPIAGWITCIMTGGTGFLLGALMAKMLKRGKVRNVGIGVLATMGVCGLFLVWTWLWWLYALCHRIGIEVTVWDLIRSPTDTWDFVKTVGEKGVWSIKHTRVSGVFLWLIWIAEAVTLFWIPLKTVRKSLNESPFCEACNAWCQTRHLIFLKPAVGGQSETLKRELESKNFSALLPLGKAEDQARYFYHVYLQGCSACDTTQTLCLDDTVVSVNDKGQQSTTIKPILRRLILTPEETVGIATTVAVLNAPPAEEPEVSETTGEAPTEDAAPAT